MPNEFYDMDNKVFISEGAFSIAPAPSPTSSQSSMSSVTSGSGYASSNGNINIMNFQNYPLNNEYSTLTSLPAHQNVFMPYSSERENKNTLVPDNCGTAGYSSQLIILEQPTEKFRFRYKSEMHGTHGSLNGERSEKNKKSFPEVRLNNFNGMGVIRCSLYQVKLDKPSPHSHQLVVRKDDMDECDPHDVYLSPQNGYIARFENMGIIHTAKKNICDALHAKKKMKLKFETGCSELSQKQEKDLRDESENEAKEMNLNQVRLCFEAFEICDGSVWKRICEPVFSRPINNRKSALTGELKICRLSSVVGSAAGGEDLILLVEKVSKKNIQVRFFEMRDDDCVWSAYGDFSDADVHHQYAIVVRTPPYMNKEIDTNVTVFIELVRRSDDERSAPLTFRYKPRDIVASRKRRRTSYQSSSSGPLSSSEVPVTVANVLQQPQQPQQQQHHHQLTQHQPQTISQEFNRDAHINSLFGIDDFMQNVQNRSGELKALIELPDDTFMKFFGGDGEIVADGAASISMKQQQNLSNLGSKKSIKPQQQLHQQQQHHPTMKLFISAMHDVGSNKELTAMKIRKIYDEYSTNNDSGNTVAHDLVKQGLKADAILLFRIFSNLDLNDLLSQPNNVGQTPLHLACIFEQPMFIRPLLGLKCDPNVQDYQGNTPLHIAINERLRECLESFTSSNSNKLNVNLANDDGFTPLHLAIRDNNIEFAKILLTKCNASAKVASSRDGNNALHLAVQHQNKQMVKYLLENCEVKINAKNGSGRTAVDLAKTLDGTKRKEILDLLLAKSGVDELKADTIKDEPDEESSGEDDDEMSSSIDGEDYNEVYMKKLLQDEEVFKHLVERLNDDNKWKKLASDLNIDHMLPIWVNAGGMLRYLVKNDKVNALKLFKAIQEIDTEAACKAISMMKT